MPPGFVRSAAAQAYLDARRLASMTEPTTEDREAALSLPGAKAEKSMWDEAALQLIRDARALLLRARHAGHPVQSPWFLGVNRWLASADAFVGDRPETDVA